MNLQNLTIIFIIIAIPVMLILSQYIGYQVDAANLKALYDQKFLKATNDALIAFQENTINNKYSTVSDSLRRDIEASINVFTNSFGATLGITGTSKANIMTYVPAIIYTLYDGYYIYSPTMSENGTFIHKLKPYVYYTKEYSKGNDRIVINYSLDNYVVVYYYGNNGKEYESQAGYLEYEASSINDTTGVFVSGNDVYYNGKKIESEILTREIWDVNGKRDIVDKSNEDACNYYKEALKFTKWYNEKVHTVGRDDLKISAGNLALPNVGSTFNDEKTRVIKESIENNLFQVMSTYKKKTTNDFELPKFKESDWEKILNNVCIVSFVQGLVAGTTTYNNYTILTSTKNKQYVNEENIYFVGSDGSYHRIGCPELKGNPVGYNILEFLVQEATGENGKKLEPAKYYYPHEELACYYCMINPKSSGLDLVEANKDLSGYEYDKRIKAYYKALAREKYNLSKISNYVNGSSLLSK